MVCARQSAAYTATAFFLAVLLAFGLPAPALAGLTAADPADDAGTDSPLATQADTREVKTYESEEGDVWTYVTTAGRNYLVGYEKHDPSTDDSGDGKDDDEYGEAGKEPEGGGDAPKSDATAKSDRDAAEGAGDSDGADEPEEPEKAENLELTLPDALGEGDQAVSIYGVSATWGDLRKDSDGNDIADSEESSWSRFASITFAAGIRDIAKKAFINCSSLQSVSFADGAQLGSIGEMAFAHCQSLRSVAFPGGSSLKSIGAMAFAHCTNLRSVAGLDSSQLESVGAKAFQAAALGSFTMPSSLRSIGSMAFLGCTSLRDVYFNAALNASTYATSTSSTVYVNPFCGAPNASFHVPSDSENYLASDGGGFLLSKSQKILYAGSTGAVIGGACSIPERVQRIAESAFAYNAELASVEIGEAVKYINKYAFMYSGLRQVAIPASVQYLGSECFGGCANLTRVEFAEGFTNLAAQGGKAQFSHCGKLGTLVLPSSMTTLSEGCFMGSGLSAVSIPTGISDIPKQAFAATDGSSGALNMVTGCAGLVTIQSEAFAGMPLTMFSFGDNIEFVSNTAFAGSFLSALPSYLEEQADGYYRFDSKVYVVGWESYERAERVLDKINKMRAGEGSGELVMDGDLMSAAMKRAAELSVRYLSSTDSDDNRPMGIPFSTVDAKAAAEIIGTGHLEWISENSASLIMRDWVDQAASVKNILDKSFKSVGIGCFLQNEDLYWVVLFGTSVDDAAVITEPSYIDQEREYGVSVRLADGFPAFEASAAVDQDALAPGDKFRISVTCVNSSREADSLPIPEKTFDFSTSDARIATVDETGVVSVVQGGTVEIYATLKGTKRSEGRYAACSITVPPQVDLSAAEVGGIQKSTVFTGEKIVQKPIVSFDGVQLVEGYDYEVSHANNRKPGEATYTISGIGNFYGAITGSFTIKQADQPMVAIASDTTLSLAKVKAAKRTVMPITVRNAAGSVTYKNVSAQKLAKQLKVKPLTGKVVVPKSSKNRIYKVQVKVSASGNKNYKKGSQTLSFKIRVK